MNSKRNFRQKSTWTISKEAYTMLRIGLPLIISQLLFLLGSFLRDRTYNATYALHYYPMILEYILMNLTLIIIGAFLFEYISKKER